MNEFKIGTYYSCGCWHGGEPHKHEEFCPTHGKPWQLRYKRMYDVLEPSKYVNIIDERWGNEDRDAR